MLEKSESYWWIFKINMQIGHFNVQHGKTKWRGEYLISPGWVWRTGQRARLLPLHRLTARLHQRGQVSLSLWRRLWSWSWCWCYKFGRVDVVFRVVKVLWESVGVVLGSLIWGVFYLIEHLLSNGCTSRWRDPVRGLKIVHGRDLHTTNKKSFTLSLLHPGSLSLFRLPGGEEES